MQARTKLILLLSLILLCGAGCPSAASAQTAGKNRQVALDSMDCRQLIAALGDVCPLSYISNMERVANSFESSINWSREEDLKAGYRLVGKEYVASQLRQDIADNMYPLFLQAFGGNEAGLRTALAASLSEKGRVMGQLDDLAYKLVELSYKAMRSTPPTKTSDAVLAAALKKEKKQWAAVDNLDPYKKLMGGMKDPAPPQVDKDLFSIFVDVKPFASGKPGARARKHLFITITKNRKENGRRIYPLV